MFLLPIPQTVIVTIVGRHAERYLQARLSNDVKRASLTQGIVAGALSPQGRTEALLALYRIAPTTFVGVCDGGIPGDIVANLSRFKVAEDVTVESLETTHGALHLSDEGGGQWLSHELGCELPADLELATTVVTTAPPILLTRRRRTTTAGLDVIAPHETLARLRSAALAAGARELPAGEATARRIEAGCLAFPEDVNAGVILSEAGLETAVSFTKGCYVGQEVIAKIDSLGKPPRRFVRLSIDGEVGVPVGSPITLPGAPDKVLGKVTSAAFHSTLGVTLLWALLKNDAHDPTHGYTVEGQRAVVRSHPDR